MRNEILAGERKALQRLPEEGVGHWERLACEALTLHREDSPDLAVRVSELIEKSYL